MLEAKVRKIMIEEMCDQRLDDLTESEIRYIAFLYLKDEYEHYNNQEIIEEHSETFTDTEY